MSLCSAARRVMQVFVGIDDLLNSLNPNGTFEMFECSMEIEMVYVCERERVRENKTLKRTAKNGKNAVLSNNSSRRIFNEKFFKI